MEGHERYDNWALIWPDGRLFIDTEAACPADCWRVGLGWPNDAEIAEAKAKGVRCVLVKVFVPESSNAELSGERSESDFNE